MYDDLDHLRRQLQALADKTRVSLRLRGAYGRGRAETRRFVLDRRAGKHAWALAHEHAVVGLSVLDRGETDKAAVFLWAAERQYITALEFVADTKRMAESVGRSGRPPKTAERDAQIVAAVEAQLDRGLKGSQAIAAAKRAEPGAMKQLGRKRVQNIMAAARKQIVPEIPIPSIPGNSRVKSEVSPQLR